MTSYHIRADLIVNVPVGCPRSCATGYIRRLLEESTKENTAYNLANPEKTPKPYALDCCFPDEDDNL